MKFKYTGDEPAVSYRGITFAKGEAIEVSDSMAYRMIDHPLFAEVKTSKAKKAKD